VSSPSPISTDPGLQPWTSMISSCCCSVVAGSPGPTQAATTANSKNLTILICYALGSPLPLRTAMSSDRPAVPPHLDRQIISVMTLTRASRDRRQFEELLVRAFPVSGDQMPLGTATEAD
jgi:hypothetical protein